METKKLFLLDALALIYRAYFAFSKNPRINSKNVNTSAMFGFTNTLLDVLNNENPTHIAVAFDTSAPTARHIDFENYKAHRQEMPEDLRISIPIIKNIIRAFNIPVIELDGYEADDIIGTLAKRAEQENFEVFMMTPDKDYGQLVTEKIKMYKPAVFGNPPEVVGIEGILKKFDIKEISQVIDILGLMGDAADNIPGIPGVGEKTAAKLLHEYGTLENVLLNADKVKGKLGEKIRDNAQQAILSKQLATIILDVPVTFDETTLLRQPPNEEVLREIFNDLEFKQLTKRVFAQSTEPASTPTNTTSQQNNLFDTEPAQPIVTRASVQLATINDVPHQYHICDTEVLQQQLANSLMQQTEFCFDTETTGIDANEAELVGMSFSFKKGEA
ncbi:MAG TPA: 5'-3' exonuclease H3TH domain-containing protein, partial [Bacteroidia bacterium]|nr:5'-3' exonuclease H3TH domain-containing protein [Bacteroidia bacterium]